MGDESKGGGQRIDPGSAPFKRRPTFQNRSFSFASAVPASLALSAGIELPFIKRGILSAKVAKTPDTAFCYIDGFNNKGFSGAPVLYFVFGQNRYAILGVVKGFQPEQAQVEINGQRADTNILVNSGILVAYTIDHALMLSRTPRRKRIRKDPQPLVRRHRIRLIARDRSD